MIRMRHFSPLATNSLDPPVDFAGLVLVSPPKLAFHLLWGNRQIVRE